MDMDINIITKLNTLGEISKLRLEKILKSISGAKDITIEPNLIRPLERICGVKWLRLHDVDKIYKFENIAPVHSKVTHLYLISANLLLFKRVIDQIQESLNTNKSMKYHIILMPKILTVLEVLLEEQGLYDIITLHSFCWEFIQIDTGILSLEIHSLFADMYVNGDLSLLPSIGFALRTLFCVTGRPNITVCVGTHAKNALKHLEIFTDNLGVPPKEDSDFDVFVIIDRSVDFISTLLTSATYAGLLGDTFKVRCGVVETKEAVESDPAASTSTAKSTSQLFNMDSVSDTVYADIKNRHISEVSEILGNQARQLKSESEVHKEMAITEIKNYVQTKLQQVTVKSKYLSSHLQACEKIIQTLGNKFETLKETEHSFIENIDKSTNIRNIEHMILRDDCIGIKLMCLMSLTQKLTLDEYNNLKLQYLHAVGYQYLYMFHNLTNCGLLHEPTKSKLPTLNILATTSKKDFYSISSKLKLIPQNQEQINVRAPTCPSYVFGGCYIPMIAQLVTMLAQAQNENEIKSKLDVVSGIITSTGITKSFPLQKRSFLVCVVGGLTYAEVAALDLVEKLCNCRIILSSNCMISANDLIEANK